MTIIDKFLTNIMNIEDKKEHSVKYLIGVSGGLDSCVLLHLCAKYIKSGLITVVNINHGLRTDSVLEGEFVAYLCEKYNVKYYHREIDLLEKAKEYKKSIEETGRIIRYEIFQEIAEMEGCDVILTAHHSKDKVESILLNIIRGTSLRGLRGTPFKRNNIFRPLINVNKNEIEKYATENNINFCEDESNYENIYSRNIVRNLVIESMKEVNAQAENNILKLSEIGEMSHDFILNAANNIYKYSIIEEPYFTEIKDEFLQWQKIDFNDKKILRYYVYELIVKRFNLNLEYKYLSEIDLYLFSNAEYGNIRNKLHLPKNIIIWKKKNRIIIYDSNKKNIENKMFLCNEKDIVEKTIKVVLDTAISFNKYKIEIKGGKYLENKDKNTIFLNRSFLNRDIKLCKILKEDENNEIQLINRNRNLTFKEKRKEFNLVFNEINDYPIIKDLDGNVLGGFALGITRHNFKREIKVGEDVIVLQLLKI